MRRVSFSRRRLLLTGAGFWPAALLLATACAAPSETSARTLRFAISEPVATLEPPTLRGLADQQYLRLVFDGLTRTDSEGRLAPGLAARWSSADGITWTFTLFPDRRFHDGTRVTARDVVRSWTALGAFRDKAPISPLLEEIDGMAAVLDGTTTTVSGLSAPDDSTVIVRLRAPRAAFPIMISRPEFGVIAASSTPTAPVGSGRWRWVSGKANDSTIVLARVDSGLVTKADTLILRVIPSPELAESMAAGTVDCTSQVLPSLHTSFVMQPSLTIIGSRPGAVARLSLRGSNPALRDVRVRAALAHALDLATISRSTGEAAVMISGRRLPEMLADGVPSREPAPYDPALARRLLSAAGADGMRIRISRLPYATQGDTLRDFVYRIRDYWTAVGLQVEVVQPKEFWRAIADSSVDAQPQYYFNGVPSSAEYLARGYSSESPLMRYAPQLDRRIEVDALLDSARRTLEPATRTRLLTTTDTLLATQFPDVVLWHVPLVSAKRTVVPSCTVGLYTDDQLRGEIPSR